MSDHTAQKRILTYSEMIAFFLPVAASMMIMMSSHSIISSALARTTDAALALAAYSVAKSVSNMFQSPCITLRRMCVALFNNKQNYQRVYKVALITAAIAFMIIIFAIFTPLSKFIFIKLIGIDESLLPHTLRAFTILMVMPLLAMIRSIYQGLITVTRKTYLLTIATTARIVVMFLLATFITNTQLVTGSIIGSILMVAGIGTEALFGFIFGRRLARQLPEDNASVETLSFKGMWIYFLPLVVAQFAMTWGQPTINAGLARSINPEIALAAYSVARGFAWIFIGMFGRIHQLPLVFAKDKTSWSKVRRFAFVLGLVNGLLLFMLSITPAGEWILLNLIGIDTELTQVALATIRIMALIPIVMSQNECYSGLLMMNNHTPVITISKFTNIGVLISTVFIISSRFPQLGPQIGSLSMLFGYIMEFAILFIAAKRYNITQFNTSKQQSVPASS